MSKQSIDEDYIKAWMGMRAMQLAGEHGLAVSALSLHTSLSPGGAVDQYAIIHCASQCAIAPTLNAAAKDLTARLNEEPKP